MSDDGRGTGTGADRPAGAARGHGTLLAVAAVAATAAATAAAALGLGGPPGPFGAADGFPHAAHVGIFPTCLGCHAGVPEGDTTRIYTVTPGECANCHDGVRVDSVDWAGPTRDPSNLAFTHPGHERSAAEAGDPPGSCGTCHGSVGGTRRMEVGRARPEACLSCHAHEAGGHLAGNARCATCHVGLARATALSEARIAGFPRPPDHRAADFLPVHGETAEGAGASCAVCHARQSCTRCHLNADRLPSVERLSSDPRIAAMVAGRAGEWPEPASHERDTWTYAHGTVAGGSLASCANCHAVSSCETCHGEAAARVAAGLPRPGRGEPKGVRVAATRPPGHTTDFRTTHGPAAATGFPNCSSCHAERECADCHERTAVRTGAVDPDVAERRARASGTAGSGREEGDVARREAPVGGGESAGGFHPLDFVVRHGAEAYAAAQECAECHSGEAFCRSCHESVGIAAVSERTSGAFHDAQADWLIAHGRAARQGLQECASCHRQSSCLRCHGARSGLRVSPHGPDFDADRLLGKAAVSCTICHFRDSFVFP